MSLRTGVELFNEGRYWEAHEAWEQPWLRAAGEEKQFLQGLIQLAAAYHHLRRGTLRGATRLFESALARLEAVPAGFCGVDRDAAVAAALRDRSAIESGVPADAGAAPKLGYNEDLSSTRCEPHASEGEMHEMDQRDRELLTALQGEIPLASTPFSFIGQSLDMSEKEVIKRVERLRREGIIRQISGQFDPRSLGYRSCLVAAHVSPERIDEAAAVISAHPGVTQNYRRNNDLNLWFTLYVSPLSTQGLEKTIEILGQEAGCETVRPLPTLRLFKNSSESDGSNEEEPQSEYVPLTPFEMECVRLLQQEFPLQPRPFDALARTANVDGNELLTTARTLQKRGQMRRLVPVVNAKRSGFVATAMGVWAVPEGDVERTAAKLAAHKAVSHCYLRPVYDDWPYNLYTTVHARSVDECESFINDLAIDTGMDRKQTLFPTREYKKARLALFSQEAAEWESSRAGKRAAAAG
jgi:DNA-binding Lrp family transcriptional regulator